MRREPKTVVEDPKAELLDVMRHPGWAGVVIPSLRAHQQELLRRLATDHRLGLIEFRVLQAQISLLTLFLTPGEERLRYLTSGVKTEDEEARES